MTEVEKKGIEKAKIGLIVCAVLVVILAISTIWLFMKVDALQGEVNSLETDVDRLTSDNDYLWWENEDLQSQVDSLTTENEDLQDENDYLWDEIDSLEEPQLHKVETYWIDEYPSPYINYYGSIFNSGSWTAYNVVITVRIYDVYDTLLKTEEIHLGNIAGKSYQTFDVDISYSGNADSVYATLTYD